MRGTTRIATEAVRTAAESANANETARDAPAGGVYTKRPRAFVLHPAERDRAGAEHLEPARDPQLRARHRPTVAAGRARRRSPAARPTAP